MPRVTPQQELDFLAELIGAEPGGMGIDAISQKLGDSHQRRTLQRRLALLVAQKRIQMFGEALYSPQSMSAFLHRRVSASLRDCHAGRARDEPGRAAARYVCMGV